MLQALLAGDIAFAITTFTPYLNYTKDGRLVGLAVTGSKRENLVPDVPTLAELGFAEATNYFWYGLFAPAQTPKVVQDRLHAETVKILADPAVREKFMGAGIEPATSTPAELAAQIRSERAKWAGVVKAAGIKVN
jgi:tripartite-type tricarboxylate transporter receptor subunit TctC